MTSFLPNNCFKLNAHLAGLRAGSPRPGAFASPAALVAVRHAGTLPANPTALTDAREMHSPGLRPIPAHPTTDAITPHPLLHAHPVAGCPPPRPTPETLTCRSLPFSSLFGIFALGTRRPQGGGESRLGGGLRRGLDCRFGKFEGTWRPGTARNSGDPKDMP